MEQMYRRKEAASLLAISERTLDRLIKERTDIEKYKVGGSVVIKESDLKKLIVKQPSLENIEI